MHSASIAACRAGRHACRVAGLVLAAAGLIASEPWRDAAQGLPPREHRFLALSWRADEPWGVDAWSRARGSGAREQAGSASTFDQLILEGRGSARLQTTRLGPFPVALAFHGDGELRHLNVEKVRGYSPRLVQVDAAAAGASVSTSSDPLAGTAWAGSYLLSDNTMPTRTMHRVRGGIAAHAQVAPKLGLHLEGLGTWSRSRAGALGDDLELRGGLSWSFHRQERVLVGAEWRSLAADRFSEDAVLPVVEWHASFGEELDLVLGFPRAGVTWRGWPGGTLRATWRFPHDGELLVDQGLGHGLGVALHGWYRSVAFTAGENQLLRDAVLGFFFVHPAPWDQVGEEVHLYVEEAGAALTLRLSQPRLFGLRAELGPVWHIIERWAIGRTRTDAHNVARLRNVLGATFALSLRW